MIITPEYVVSFESNLQSIIVDRWADFNADPQLSYWDDLAETKPSDSREEIYEWQVNRAKIRLQEDQGTRRYDDLWNWGFAIENESYGDNLELKTIDFEDRKVEHASQWAADIGGYSAYFPQKSLQDVLAAAESEAGYDEVPFFSTAHPRVPGIATSGAWPNLFVGASWTLTADHFAAAVAEIKKIKGPGGINRFLRPRRLWAAPSSEFAGKLILNAQFYGKDGSTDNVLRQYGFDAPRTMQDHPDDGSWYIQCDVLGVPFKKPLVYQVRKGWEMNTYADVSQVELNRIKKWEWHFDGRVAMALGEPSALFKFKPS